MAKPDWTKAPLNAEVWIEDLLPGFVGDESNFCYLSGDRWVECGSDGYWSEDSEVAGEIKVHYRPSSKQSIKPGDTVVCDNSGKEYLYVGVARDGGHVMQPDSEILIRFDDISDFRITKTNQ